jgi:hypothetical protein
LILIVILAALNALTFAHLQMNAAKIRSMLEDALSLRMAGLLTRTSGSADRADGRASSPARAMFSCSASFSPLRYRDVRGNQIALFLRR